MPVYYLSQEQIDATAHTMGLNEIYDTCEIAEQYKHQGYHSEAHREMQQEMLRRIGKCATKDGPQEDTFIEYNKVKDTNQTMPLRLI